MIPVAPAARLISICVQHCLLEQVLDAGVDGEPQVASIDRFSEEGDRIGNAAAGGVFLGGDLSGDPGQHRILGLLHAVRRGAVVVDEAQDLRGERRLRAGARDRVDALRLGKQSHSADAERPDALGDVRGDAALQEDPGSIVIDPGADIGGRHVEGRGEQC